MRLRDIDLPVEAEDAIAVLRKGAFVEHEAYRAMLNIGGICIVGRKGDGKSATRIGLKESNGMARELWLEMSMKSFDPSKLNDLIRDQARSKRPQQLLLRRIWRFTILCGLARAARNHQILFKRVETLRTRVPSFLKKYRLQDDTFDVVPDRVLENVLYVRDWPTDPNSLAQFPLDDESLQLESSIISALGHDKGLGSVITVDDLDPCLEMFDEMIVPAAQELVAMSRDLVRLYGEKYKFRIKCFVPRDMFSQFDDRHLDKMAKNTTEIQWSAQDLEKLLARYLAPYMEGRLRSDPDLYAPEVVAKVLGTHVVGYVNPKVRAFDMVKFHSTYRPRDILYFTQQLINRQVAQDSDSEEINATKFVYYLSEATRERSQTAITEYSGKYPILRKQVELLRGLSARFKGSRLRSIWQGHNQQAGQSLDEGDWEFFLQGLFDSGVLGFFSLVPSQATLREAAVFSFANPTGRLSSDLELAIHPMFWQFLQTIPKKFVIYGAGGGFITPP
ncbi:MAG: hypothetical protein DHS20C16_29630 [Phycisphaerae bacterium]|nr:MAG: hypothetical protein DHS20C16_29630 [Phycisphaerae bacterium]